MRPPLLILIAGPYRTGTGDDPAARQRGLPVYHRLEDVPGCSAPTPHAVGA